MRKASSAKLLQDTDLEPLWTEEKLEKWTSKWNAKKRDFRAGAGLREAVFRLDHAIALMKDTLKEYHKERSANRVRKLATRVTMNQDDLIYSLATFEVEISYRFNEIATRVNPCVNVVNHLRVFLKRSHENQMLRAFPDRIPKNRILKAAKGYEAFLKQVRKSIDSFIIPSTILRQDDPDVELFRKHMLNYLNAAVVSVDDIRTFVCARGCVYLDMNKQKLICARRTYDLSKTQVPIILAIFEIIASGADSVPHSLLLRKMSKSEATERHFLKNNLFSRKLSTPLGELLWSTQLGGRGQIQVRWDKCNRGTNPDYFELRKSLPALRLDKLYPYRFRF